MKPSRAATVRSFQTFLRANGLVFSCAESCTGGLLSRQMTALAGSSDVFWGGVVSYANEAKVRLLGVDPELLGREGAVSGAVASAMVRGLVDRSGTGLAVSVTGVAGPGGGTPDKPVGTVWFGMAAFREGRGSVVALRHGFSGSRAQIQAQTALWARVLAQHWWESRMDLDSLRSLVDNHNKPFVEALQPPSLFTLNPL